MLLACSKAGCQALVCAPSRQPRQRSRLQVACKAPSSDSGSSSSVESPSPGLGLKAVWHGAEALGNIIGASKGPSNSMASSTQTLTRQEAVAAVREDYSVNYFVSGTGSMAAYADDCVFADPFASFKGTQRFRNNVSNLGALLTEIQLDLLSFEEGPGPHELTTRWRFSAILDLPWRPRLAAAGGTTHVFDPNSGLVVQHIERWDSKPGAVVASLLKPAAKVPATFAEVLMVCLSSGDVLGVWFVLSSGVARAALPLSVALAVLHLVRGEGLGGWEAACYLGLVAGLTTEMAKIVRNVMGGESG